LQSPIGAAVLNGVLVIKFGMEKLITTALISFSWFQRPAFLYSPIRCACFVAVFRLAIFQYRFSFSEIMRAMLGHIAGTAAAVTGCISTIMAVTISIYIGRFIAETALPLLLVFQYAPPWQLVYLFI
jgi:DHA1 family bicyclomycin/chloramphenicol resistance-like MFS transporter